EVDTPKALVETTKLLAISGVPAGDRTFFVTFSGGACTLVAEQAPARGIGLANVTEENRAVVVDTLPDNIHIANPFDLNLPWQARSKVTLQDAASLAQCMRDVTRGEADCIVMLLDVPRAGDGQDEPWLASLEAIVEVSQSTGLPCVAGAILPEGLSAQQRGTLQTGGVAALMGLRETLDALGATLGYKRRRQAIVNTELPLELLELPAVSDPIMLDEAHSKALLACEQLPMPRRWCGAVSEAIEAADRIGYPIALKVLSNTVAHKHKSGGVALDLKDANALSQSLEAMALRLAEQLIEFKSVLVERMVADPLHEMIIGIKRHDQLGLALLIGRGGVTVEESKDYALVLLPATPREFEAALICVDPGLTPNAREQLLQAMNAVADFACAHADRIIELDINPLIVGHDSAVTAVDALVVMGRENTYG
ncbi:MAG: acetate--CoA ligase family protein, partial [Pseudomonadota bacterium]